VREQDFVVEAVLLADGTVARSLDHLEVPEANE